jgi:hypothetical protein
VYQTFAARNSPCSVDAGRGRQRLALGHQAIGLVADEADAGGLADLDGHVQLF